jgi:hypothetical protein
LCEPLNKLAFITEVGGIEILGETASARCYSGQIMFREDGGIRKFVGI